MTKKRIIKQKKTSVMITESTKTTKNDANKNEERQRRQIVKEKR
jgi:hypothetical protein